MESSQHWRKTAANEAQSRAANRVHGSRWQEWRTAEILSNATGEVKANACVTPGLRCFVHYGSAQQRLLREAFALKSLNVPLIPVLKGHVYVKQADSGWSEEHCISHHSYLTPESFGLSDAEALLTRTAFLWVQKRSWFP